MTISTDPTEVPLERGVAVIQGHRVRLLRNRLYAVDEPAAEGSYAGTVALVTRQQLPGQLQAHRDSGRCRHPEVFSGLQ